ncbi:siderophore ABC transporter substrate-binding protein [Shimia thalassica]|uniref:siderophore ABC transporter substrate-binding protein n=1 Tax=Shimia thalassica TaxID=1715693 RepID=UPI0027351D19|nr:siderophore ABC transporter substrate-binding protein [Shimia thalassica]MDP2579973.1 siderophore ABC transporter substrate-binding protein [Shimia thalassica]
MFRSLALALACVAGPLFADTVSIETAKGVVDVDVSPDKIAVFDVSALDTLDALGVAADGVLANVYVDYLADATQGGTIVGSLFEPDFEAVYALDPDLIIAGGRSSTQVEALGEIAPTIDMTIWGDTIAQALARLEAYGLLFDKTDEAAALRTAFDAKLDAARMAVAGRGKALIVLTNGPKVSAYGSNGRFGWLHTALDLPEAVKDVAQSNHGEAISFEFIRDANPDILIVIDRMAAIARPGDNAEATLDNPLVHETNAWKDGNILYLNAADIYIASGGIQSLGRTLDQFIQSFPAE